MTLTFTDSARERMSRIGDHLRSVARAYGERSEDFRAMAESFAHVVTGIAGLGGTVTPDGSGLSLYVVTDYGMHVGAIFHVDDAYRRCRQEGPYGYHAQWCMTHERPVASDGWCAGNGTDVDYTRPCVPSVSLVPVTGSWSLHS